jgi:hypothetical protein
VLKLWHSIADMCRQLNLDKSIAAIILKQPTIKALSHGATKCFEEVNTWSIPLMSTFAHVLEHSIGKLDIDYKLSKELLE